MASEENKNNSLKKEDELKKQNEEKDIKDETQKKESNLEEKKSKKTIKKDSAKEDAKTKKEIKKEVKENEVKETSKKQKKTMKIMIAIAIIISVLLFFSIIFSLININNTTFISGIQVAGVDISGMTLSQAKTEMQKIVDTQMNNNINITYKGETINTIKPEDIKFNYDLNTQLRKIYEIGRNGNIFKNNYEILFTLILKKDLNLEYTYGEEEIEKIIKDLEPSVPELVKNPSYYREGDDLIIISGVDGVIINQDELKSKILEQIVNNKNNNDIKVEVPVLNKTAEEIDLEKIHQEIYCEPKDAHYVEEPFELFMDEDGVDFAITIEEAKKIISTEAEEYTIPLKITKAKVTINDIDASAFRYKISTFSTSYDAGYRARANNLELAAGKINGKVLGPGEEFSFNEVVGKRTIEAGYTEAKIFLNGEVVDGTGGGICQISTTLYNAVLLANLEITDRRNHNYTTSYVKAGRDATVVYGAIDFKFKNNRKYPIKIDAKVSGGVVTFDIYGIQEENEYEVKIIPVVTQSIPKTTQYVDDPTLAEGSEVVKQVGSSGCKVTTYKEVYLNGTLISKDVISNDTYKAMARIVRRGTKKASVPVVSEPVKETPTQTEEPTPQPEVQQPAQPPPSVPDINDTTE